jgi:hypothetical protein
MYYEANSEAKSQYNHMYYEANSEDFSQYNHAYNVANSEAKSQYNHVYNKANSEAKSQYNQVYNQANSEVKRRHNHQYYRDHQVKKTKSTSSSSTLDFGGDNVDMESFCQFLDDSHRNRIQNRLLKKIAEQMKSTCVGGDLNKHRANVCVVCDEIIFGMEPVQNISKARLLENDTRLCVSQYEQHFGIQLHPELVRQYQVNF